jgi:shikimate kinase
MGNAPAIPIPHDGNIVLVGFMGCGKSSVGRLLASWLGFAFVDTDQLIVERAGMEIPSIFEARGEAGFREVERSALESIRGRRRSVIATGGGIVTRPEHIAILREIGFVVWLRANEEIIFERVSRNNRRPLLQTENPRGTIARLLAERSPLYAAAAHEAIDSSRQPHAEIARRIRLAASRHFAPGPHPASAARTGPVKAISHDDVAEQIL